MKTLLAIVLMLLFQSIASAAPAEPVFVAVGQQGRRAMSRDGVLWEHDQRWDPASTAGEHALHAIAFGHGRFIAVGQTGDRGRILSSRDGAQWTELPATSGGLTTVAFARERFIVGDVAGLLVSTDGEHFEEGARHPEFGTFRALECASGDTEAGFRTVLIGEADLPGQSARLPWRAATGDGTRFEHHATHTAPATDIAYGSGHFVVVGAHGLIESSHDAQTWQRHIVDTTADFTAVVWTGRRFLVSGDKTAWTSPDGLTWQAESDPLPGRLVWAREGSGGLCLAGQTLFYSKDLVHWKHGSLPSGPAFVAVASSGP